MAATVDNQVDWTPRERVHLLYIVVDNFERLEGGQRLLAEVRTALVEQECKPDRTTTTQAGQRTRSHRVARVKTA